MYTKTNDKYWLAFASIEQISSNFILELYLHFKDIQKAWNACLNDLVKIKNLRKSTVEKFLYFRDKTDPDKCLNYIKKKI